MVWCRLVQFGAGWCNFVQVGVVWCSLVQVVAVWWLVSFMHMQVGVA